jgi:outer membrane protein OmpA-like peptidoglycan-associated protein
MSFSLRHASLAACLAAVAACAGAAPRSPPPEHPAPAAASTTSITAGAGVREPAAAPGRAPPWRTYVPERCRDREGNPTKGCRTRRIVTTSTSIEILAPVTFVDNTAEPSPASHRTIEAVARALLDNPSILVLEVRGHSDSLLHPADRAELSSKRAEAVAALLISHGVAPARVTTYGASDSELRYPADDARNRRVEFIILARDE